MAIVFHASEKFNVNYRHALSLAFAGIVAQAAGAPNVQAADAESHPNGDGLALESVIVTARRVSENLMETPISVTAFTAEAIAARDITSLESVARYTPGMTFSNGGPVRVDGAYQTIIIRGMTPQSSQTVSVFIDGAPITGGFVSGIDDVERVEVLKGPQNTAFGRQAFAGAVNVVTKDPSFEPGGRVTLVAGTDNQLDTRIMLEGPILKDKLAMRLATRYSSQDGQYDNVADPGTRLGDQQNKTVGLSLLFTPTDGLRFKYFGQYYRQEDSTRAVAHFDQRDFNCNAGAAPSGELNYICGTLPSFPRSRLGPNVIMGQEFVSNVINNDAGLVNPIFKDGLGLRHGGMLMKAYHHHLSGDFDIPAWNVKASLLAAMDRNESSVLVDADNVDTRDMPNPAYGTPGIITEPFINWPFNFQQLDNGHSFELRLQPLKADRISWLIGANYVYQNAQLGSSAMLPFGVSNQLNGNPTRTETTGIFGSVGMDIFTNLNLTVEGRYQSDKVSAHNRAPNDGPITSYLDQTYDNFLPRVTLGYKFTPNWFAYASYSKGVNPGTFNGQFVSLPPAQQEQLTNNFGVGADVLPEKLTNYEVGAKGTFFEQRLQVSVALYHAIWTDQISNENLPAPVLDADGNPTGDYTGINLLTNAGETDLDGVEFEASWRASEALTMGLSGAIAGTDIQKFSCVYCESLTGSTDLSGNQLASYSKYSTVLYGEYRAPFETISGSDWYARGDYSYKSGMYDSPANIVKTQDSNLVNFRVGLETERLGLEAFVLNAFDDDAYLTIENQVDPLSPAFSQRAVNAAMANKRMFGLRARFNF